MKLNNFADPRKILHGLAAAQDDVNKLQIAHQVTNNENAAQEFDPARSVTAPGSPTATRQDKAVPFN